MYHNKIENGVWIMQKLASAEMKQINGGTTYRCTYCGFTSTNILRMGLHFGVKTWHYLSGGRIEEV